MWRLMRANLLPSVGLEHEALDDARKAVELDPGFWLGWADLGLLHARRHQHPEAMQCAERAMTGAPWCPYSIGVMAAALANQGQVNEAQPLLDGLRGDAYGGPVRLAVYSLDTQPAPPELAAPHGFARIPTRLGLRPRLVLGSLGMGSNPCLPATE
jgi:hypothetical protein